jgi:hypothetical protein
MTNATYEGDPMAPIDIFQRVNSRGLLRFGERLEMLINLGVGLRHDVAADTFSLVQKAKVHPCDRVVASTANDTDQWGQLVPWHAHPEAVEDIFAEDLFQHLQDTLYIHESYRREIGPVKSELFWFARKMLRPYRRNDFFFRDTVAVLHRLQQEQGFTNQSLHELVHHYPIWLMGNPEFEGMPHDIVLRMHGLGHVLDDAGNVQAH